MIRAATVRRGAVPLKRIKQFESFKSRLRNSYQLLVYSFNERPSLVKFLFPLTSIWTLSLKLVLSQFKSNKITKISPTLSNEISLQNARCCHQSWCSRRTDTFRWSHSGKECYIDGTKTQQTKLTKALISKINR